MRIFGTNGKNKIKGQDKHDDANRSRFFRFAEPLVSMGKGITATSAILLLLDSPLTPFHMMRLKIEDEIIAEASTQFEHYASNPIYGHWSEGQHFDAASIGELASKFLELRYLEHKPMRLHDPNFHIGDDLQFFLNPIAECVSLASGFSILALGRALKRKPKEEKKEKEDEAKGQTPAEG